MTHITWKRFACSIGMILAVLGTAVGNVPVITPRPSVNKPIKRVPLGPGGLGGLEVLEVTVFLEDGSVLWMRVEQ